MKKRYFLIVFLTLFGAFLPNAIEVQADDTISMENDVEDDAVSSIYMYDEKGNKVNSYHAGTFVEGDTYQISGIQTDKEDELIYQSSSFWFASVDENGLVTIKCNDPVSRADIAIFGFKSGSITVTPKSNPDISVKITMWVREKTSEEKNDNSVIPDTSITDSGADNTDSNTNTDTKQEDVKTSDVKTDDVKADFAKSQEVKADDAKIDDNHKAQVKTKIAKTKINHTKVKSKNVRIDYNVHNASLYKIQISTKKKFPKKTTKEYHTSKRTFTIKKLKRNTVYYIRVRGIHDEVYGKWSKVKKVKTKK